MISWMRDNTDEIMSACDDPAVGSGMRLSDLIRSCYNMEPDDYFAMKSQTNDWGDELELAAYSYWRSVNVHVFQPTPGQPTVFRLGSRYDCPTPGRPSHELVFVNGNHYNVLLRKETIEANLGLDGGNHYMNVWFRQASSVVMTSPCTSSQITTFRRRTSRQSSRKSVREGESKAEGQARKKKATAARIFSEAIRRSQQSHAMQLQLDNDSAARYTAVSSQIARKRVREAESLAEGQAWKKKAFLFLSLVPQHIILRACPVRSHRHRHRPRRL